MKSLLKLTFLLLFITLMCISFLAFSQEAPKLNQDKLFQIVGELQVQLRIQSEYIDNLLTENKKLKDENEKLRKDNGLSTGKSNSN